jgi:TP901 family phage tail tape measure protein
VTDRTVNVRLNLDNSGAQRTAVQSEQSMRRVGQAATVAGTEQQNAFQSAAVASQRAMERTAAVAQASGRATQESVRATSGSVARLAEAAEGVPTAFASAATLTERALGGMATSATAAANSVVAAETRMSEASVAAATGMQASLAQRLVAGQALVAQQTTLAAATTSSAAVQGAAFTRTAAASQTATTGMARLTEVTAGVPTAFASAATIAARASEGIATSATAAAAAVVAADGRMTAATAAAAAGTQLSLANRLAVSQALIAQQTGLAAGAAAQTSSFTRLAAAGTQAEKSLTGIRTAGLAMLAMFAAASFEAARFEKAMSGVGAVADATSEQMAQLRDAALAAGRDTAFTASQAADAEGELARAGVSVSDIVGGALTGALSLAAAGQLSLGESATIAAQAMNTFGLKGADVTHIADVLAAGANKSASDVHGLGESLRMGGLLAHQTGLSLEDTVAVLSAFADHALIGSDAGTSLKTMLQRLTPQSTEAANMMAKLNFSAYDAQGNFVGLTELSARMQRSFATLTPEARNSAMGIIFGSDAVRAASILYEQGSLGITEYRKAVDDNGAAARMAGVQMNNLAGDLQYLKGSLEVALIQSGTEANKILREMVQTVNAVVTAYAALPGWAQASAAGLLLLGGALAVVGGGFLLLLPRIAAFQTSLATLATTMPRMATAASLTMRALGPLGIALTVATVALGIFGGANSDAKKQTEDLTAAVKADGAAVGSNTKAWVAHELETRGALKAAQDLGINTADLTAAILGNEDALKRVNAQLGPAKQAALDYAQAAGDANSGQDDLGKSVTSVEDALKSLNPQVNSAVAAAQREGEASADAAGSTKALGSAATATADDMKDTRSETEKLSDALDGLNGKNIDATKAAISMQSSLADLKKTVQENGTSLDITTEKGRNVKDAFLSAAEAAMKHAEAVSKQTGSTEEANIVLGHDIDMLKQTMQQAHFTKDQIDSLTAAYASVPETVATKVTDPEALKTIADLQAVKKAVEDVPPGKHIDVKAPNEQAIGDLEAIGYTVTHLPNGKVRVTVPTNDAFDGATSIQHMINGITGRTVRVTITGETIFVGGKGQARLAEADGGIVRYGQGGIRSFASGGEHHVAQIAPAGAWRLWAEPETGGEAYIPLAPGKRDRSMSILAQVAERFGMQLAPLGRDLIPARQLVGAGGSGATYDQSRTQHVHLHGAKQSAQEQLADVLRHLETVS